MKTSTAFYVPTREIIILCEYPDRIAAYDLAGRIRASIPINPLYQVDLSTIPLSAEECEDFIKILWHHQTGD